ncbi:NAD(P)-dependent alcohol dehydrogenase [Herbiconiux moechotypicola]|uniref:NAD(P)-dependent alcohol dehydrogenase n=1 Tax=Herbiconiux moechotypicola TaxID=637393 RepID=A0ABP5QJ62_9MICO|nr:NAD(P)-dependent alcohol dehydrogenase [Herbiconiux moechotypicola]MCS5730063.1 NAD(P)-dependent alcohol dehydrogenase [Herbiconiux moechotypicola]
MTVAAVTEAAGEPFRFEEVRLDAVRPDEVRVRLVATGVCHTDLSAASGALPFPLPGVLGHEGAGVVEEVGDDVTDVRPGDRVLLSFASCGRCRGCASGHPSACESHQSLNLFGGRRADGSATVHRASGALNAHFFGQSSFATEAIVPARSVVVLPADTTDDELAVLAPLGCGMQTGAGAVLRVLRPTPGSTLAVTGAGAVGLAAVMACALLPGAQDGRVAGVRIVVVDRVPARLELARELGAHVTVVPDADGDFARALLEATDGRGVDAAIEATGSSAVLEQLVTTLAPRGECAVVGSPPEGTRASFDINRLLPGRVIRGVAQGDSDPRSFLPELVAAWRDGRFPLERLQRRFPFRSLPDAAAAAASGEVVKPVLVF